MGQKVIASGATCRIRSTSEKRGHLASGATSGPPRLIGGPPSVGATGATLFLYESYGSPQHGWLYVGARVRVHGTVAPEAPVAPLHCEAGCKRCGKTEVLIRVVLRRWWLCGQCWRETTPEPEPAPSVVPGRKR